MRTSEERITEMHRRISARKQLRLRRRYRFVGASLYVFCLVLVVFFSVGISRLPAQESDAISSGAAASIFAGHAPLGFVVVALLALSLGVMVTVFCHRLQMHAKEKPENRKP